MKIPENIVVFEASPEKSMAELLENYIQCELLNFCGCGKSETNLEYIRIALELVELAQDKEKETWKEFMNRYKQRCNEHFKSSNAEYFMWYWLDSVGLTEHGGSVPGWLTEDGQNLLKWLNKWKDLSK